jgi:serine/threonine protein kinase
LGAGLISLISVLNTFLIISVSLGLQQILEAVRTIHDERIVHSDLKPANFMLVRGELKLIDFGIAKAIQNDTTNIVKENQVC